MATYTPNLNLVKPAMDDYSDIRVLNGNMDILDEKVKTTLDDDEAIRQQLKAMLGESAWNSTPADTIKHIVELLGLGGIEAQFFVNPNNNHHTGYIKFKSGFILQFGENDCDTTGKSVSTYTLPMKEFWTAWACDCTYNDVSVYYFSVVVDQTSTTKIQVQANDRRAERYFWFVLGKV